MKYLISVFVLCSIVFARDFYVSPQGNDGESGLGSIDSPVASLNRVVELAKNYIHLQGYPNDGITIHISGGHYRITETIEFSEEFDGTENAPIVIKPKNSQEVVISGGVEMRLSDFDIVSDEKILQRLPSEAQGKVRSFNLRSLGITDYGELPLYGHSMQFLDKGTDYKTGLPMPELFFNNSPMTLARWPNNDYAKIDTIVENGSVPRSWMEDLKGNTNAFSLGVAYVPLEKRDNPPKGFAFTIDSDRLKRWVDAQDAWMFGFWYWNWSDQSVKIKDIDIEKKIISSVQPSAYGLREGQHFYVYNLLEEIEKPGEWYLDRSKGILYLYPPSSDDDAKINLSLFADTMIRLCNTSNVRIKGIKFEVSRGSVVSIERGFSNLIHNCTIKNISGDAISIKGGRNNGVFGCKIYGIGESGISLAGGDRKTLTPAGNFARDNHIHNFSRIVQTYTPAVRLSGVGNIVANNKINDAPHSAIIFEGNDHIIEYNEIFDVLKNATDAGAIYAGRSHTMWGNKIRNNYFHHIETNIDNGSNSGHARLVHCIYLDDTMSGIDITGNVFYKVKEAIVASGSDITFANNIIIDSKSAVWWKSRIPKHIDYGEYHSEEERLKVVRGNNTIAEDIKAMPYDSPVWRQSYPNLVTSIEKTYGPQRCVIENNVIVNTPSADGIGMSHLENIILKDNMYLNEAVLATGIVKDNLVFNSNSTFEKWAKQRGFTINNGSSAQCVGGVDK